MTSETIPEEGAEIFLENYSFIIESVTDTKIETIKVIVHDENSEQPSTE